MTLIFFPFLPPLDFRTPSADRRETFTHDHGLIL